jgi:hypothetical protein
LARNHKALKILKKLKIIGKLEDDPDSIYAHSLVEYALDTIPTELTLLFAVKEVKVAFQRDMYKTDQEEFQKNIVHQFNTHKKLDLLRKIYRSTDQLGSEIQRFLDLYDYFTTQTAKPFQLKNTIKTTFSNWI